jgi:myo-inositol 2-dehydrogenase/D-chiro-inositol 1-dehydrogenase
MSELNRREFIAAAGATAAASAISAVAHAEGNDTIGIGMIGIGSRGSVHLGNIVKVPGVKVVALCDNNPDHLKRAVDTANAAGHANIFATPDWKELVARKEVNAVISALPCDLHCAAYLDVIAAGKDLYGEKPMCIKIEDLDKVVAAAKGAPKQMVQIGFQRRFDPRFADSMKLIHAGELGRLVEGRIHWSNSWGPLYDWFGKRERSGDWMVEQACHNWDVMNWANQGIPKVAVGLGHDDLFRDKQPDRNVHDYYSAVVQYPNGCIVNIIHSWISPSSFDAEHTRLNGTLGGIEFNAGLISYRPELKKPNLKAYKFDGPIDQTVMAHAAFINSIKTRTPPAAGVEEGRNAALTCLLVRQAVYTKSVVTMDQLLTSKV